MRNYIILHKIRVTKSDLILEPGKENIMNFVPKSINKPAPGLLCTEWEDGFMSTIKIDKLRTDCPCADCREKDETGTAKVKYMMPLLKPGQNELIALEPVGNYAINAVWGDGHNSGIYPWEYFRIVFETHQLNEQEIEIIKSKSNTNKSVVNLRSN
jgi:DUF971 family protein